MTPGKIQTVTGLVDPKDVGLTLPHEHLIIDLTGDFAPDPNNDRWSEPLSLANYYEQRRYSHLFDGNFVLDSVQDAVDELLEFRALGGDCLVDLTLKEIGRDPAALLQIANESGVKIVMGAGFYTHEYLGDGVRDADEAQLRDQIISELTEGVSVGDGIQVYPGVIGEVGTSWPIRPVEKKILRAVAAAQTQTGVGVNIHPGGHPDAPIEAVRILERAGGDPSRTAVSHVDCRLPDLADYLQLAEIGCFLELDLFGEETAYRAVYSDQVRGINYAPNDGTRLDRIIALFDKGYGNKVLVSHDIARNTRVKKYGGEGRSHILRDVVPMMKDKGLSESDLHQIMVTNPVELLTVA